MGIQVHRPNARTVGKSWQEQRKLVTIHVKFSMKIMALMGPCVPMSSTVKVSACREHAHRNCYLTRCACHRRLSRTVLIRSCAWIPFSIPNLLSTKEGNCLERDEIFQTS